jgi:hypothetical protein
LYKGNYEQGTLAKLSNRSWEEWKNILQISESGYISKNTIIQNEEYLSEFSLEKLDRFVLAAMCARFQINTLGFAWLLRRRLRNHFSFIERIDQVLLVYI